MKFTIEIDTEQDGEGVADRMLNADDAYHALASIRSAVRAIYKYEDLSSQNAHYFVEKIYEIVCARCAEARLEDRWQ